MKTTEKNAATEVTAAILKFFGALDDRRYDDVARLMSVEGTWHRQGSVLRGPVEVLAALEKRPLDLTTVHSVSNIVVSASFYDADATFLCTVFSHEGATSDEPKRATKTQVAKYKCSLSLNADGEWNVRSLSSKILFRN